MNETQLGGFNVLKRCRDGLMVFNKNDFYVGGSLLKYGEFSHIEMVLFYSLVKDTDVVIEVGANIGAHTVGLSRLAKQVYAFEPQRLCFYQLCANLALNSIENVWAKQIGLGEKRGHMYVPSPSPNAVGNFGGISLVDSEDASDYQTEPVGVYRLDELGLPPCNFIKIDVEGMERQVLQGGCETIMRDRPVLYVENDRPGKSPELERYLKENLNYRFFWHCPPLFNQANWDGNMENIFPNIVSANILCLPNDSPEADELQKKLGVA